MPAASRATRKQFLNYLSVPLPPPQKRVGLCISLFHGPICRVIALGFCGFLFVFLFLTFELSLTFVILIMVYFGVGLLGSSCLRLSLLPIPGYLFPSLGLESVQP